VGCGFGQACFGASDDYYRYSFITDKDPDDLATFYGSEDFMEIFCVLPFMGTLMMQGRRRTRDRGGVMMQRSPFDEGFDEEGGRLPHVWLRRIPTLDAEWDEEGDRLMLPGEAFGSAPPFSSLAPFGGDDGFGDSSTGALGPSPLEGEPVEEEGLVSAAGQGVGGDEGMAWRQFPVHESRQLEAAFEVYAAAVAEAEVAGVDPHNPVTPAAMQSAGPGMAPSTRECFAAACVLLFRFCTG
jgi:hypothetical protein